jgi:hypothetical protein
MDDDIAKYRNNPTDTGWMRRKTKKSEVCSQNAMLVNRSEEEIVLFSITSRCTKTKGYSLSTSERCSFRSSNVFFFMTLLLGSSVMESLSLLFTSWSSCTTYSNTMDREHGLPGAPTERWILIEVQIGCVGEGATDGYERNRASGVFDLKNRYQLYGRDHESLGDITVLETCVLALLNTTNLLGLLEVCARREITENTNGQPRLVERSAKEHTKRQFSSICRSSKGKGSGCSTATRTFDNDARGSRKRTGQEDGQRPWTW